jgi:hypothetical protein
MLRLSAFLAALAAALPARAALITYDFTGTVTEIDSEKNLGKSIAQTVSIEIMVNTNVVGGPTSWSGLYSTDPSFPFNVVFPKITVDTQLITAPIQNLSYDSNHVFIAQGGKDGIALNFDLTGALPGALPSSGIPLTLDPSLFAGGTFIVRDSSFPTNPAFAYEGTINGLAASQAVPEPMTLSLIGMGIVGIAVARRRTADS